MIFFSRPTPDIANESCGFFQYYEVYVQYYEVKGRAGFPLVRIYVIVAVFSGNIGRYLDIFYRIS